MHNFFIAVAFNKVACNKNNISLQKLVDTFTLLKKFLVAILTLLYMSTSVGATIHMHYCMGKLADWGLGQKDSKTCGKCGMEQSVKKANGCCKDEHKFIKNDTDQKHTETAFQTVPLTADALLVSFFEIPAVDLPTLTEENPLSNAPPRNSGVAVYIRNCDFRI